MLFDVLFPRFLFSNFFILFSSLSSFPFFSFVFLLFYSPLWPACCISLFCFLSNIFCLFLLSHSEFPFHSCFSPFFLVSFILASLLLPPSFFSSFPPLLPSSMLYPIIFFAPFSKMYFFLSAALPFSSTPYFFYHHFSACTRLSDSVPISFFVIFSSFPSFHDFLFSFLSHLSYKTFVFKIYFGSVLQDFSDILFLFSFSLSPSLLRYFLFSFLYPIFPLFISVPFIISFLSSSFRKLSFGS